MNETELREAVTALSTQATTAVEEGDMESHAAYWTQGLLSCAADLLTGEASPDGITPKDRAKVGRVCGHTVHDCTGRLRSGDEFERFVLAAVPR